MKFVSFLLLNTATIINAFGQEKQNDIPTFESPKVQIGVSFSPDYCFRTLKNNDGSTSSESILKLNNDIEIAKMGYTTGLNVIFNLKKNIGLETGIQWSNKGYQAKIEGLTFGDMIDPKQGFVFNTSAPAPTRMTISYNYYYIDIPLKVNYSFGKKKIRFITSAGLTTNVFIEETSKSITEYDDGTSIKTTQPTVYDYNRLNVSSLVSVGTDWEINKKHSLRVESTFRYGILKIINTPVTGYLWNAGLNISYCFGLK